MLFFFLFFLVRVLTAIKTHFAHNISYGTVATEVAIEMLRATKLHSKCLYVCSVQHTPWIPTCISYGVETIDLNVVFVVLRSYVCCVCCYCWAIGQQMLPMFCCLCFYYCSFEFCLFSWMQQRKSLLLLLLPNIWTTRNSANQSTTSSCCSLCCIFCFPATMTSCFIDYNVNMF